MSHSGVDLRYPCAAYHKEGRIQEFNGSFSKLKHFSRIFQNSYCSSRISRIDMKFKDFKDFFKDVNLAKY